MLHPTLEHAHIAQDTTPLAITMRAVGEPVLGLPYNAQLVPLCTIFRDASTSAMEHACLAVATLAQLESIIPHAWAEELADNVLAILPPVITTLVVVGRT